ncbi:DNA repair endonuclease XPF [Blomia tropicalis]|nr:DNA repair endonuclease XPF [Blomia tropicalis]
MREFRSQLPACVHKMNIELEPVTLEIGDYIITPDTCLERKSIADLIGSLNSGRLYYQTQMMTRYYKRPLLLIEFEDSKSFNFKARYWKSLQSNLKWSSRPNPLIQLAVLTIHFPLLRLIWSPSPLFSAFIIDQLKKDKDEPDKDNDVIRLSTLAENGLDLVTIGGKELPREYVTDRYDIEAKDFLLSLPGVTTGNVYSIMNRVESMLALVDLKIEELTEIMGSSQHAEQLYHALHCKLVDDDPEEHQTKANEKKRFVIKRKTNNKK